MVCGLAAALWAIRSVAARAPSAEAVSVTEIVQLLPAASEAGAMGQVVVTPKSGALAPTIDTLEI